MVTRKTAIAKLRATGTLSDKAAHAHVIASGMANTPTAKATSQLIKDNKGQAGKRLLAPSLVQGVLP